MSGIGARRTPISGRRPFVTVAIILAVLVLAAACTGGDTGRQGVVEAQAQRAPASDAVAELVGYSSVEVAWAVPGQDDVEAFYFSREWHPVWIAGNGSLTPRGAVLIDRLARADAEGIDPRRFRVDEIMRALAQADPAGLSAAELLLSHALVRYAEELGGESADAGAVLQQAAAADDIAAYLDRLAPADAGYERLRDALGLYRSIKHIGGWEPVPEGGSLRPAIEDERLPLLRRRLALTGDLPADAGVESLVYDKSVEAAVRRFQKRHGLDVDGMVGARTLVALNLPVGARVEEIADTMRRLRAPAFRFGDRAIVVNLAAAELRVIMRGEEVLRSRTIIGQRGWETPMVASEIKTLVINPTWSVPKRIALEELLPLIRRDGRAYLDQRGFRMFDWRSREIEFESVDLAAVNENNLPFILRQDPGPANPLGNVKFLFPNDHDVYLHDTRARRLFDRSQRALSHGCVRVELADELAILLLGREKGWSRKAYEAAVASGQTRWVRLPQPMPLHIVSQSVWVEEDGTVQFREHPYGSPRSREIQLAQLDAERR